MSLELLSHPAARLLTLALLHFLWQGLLVAALLVAVTEVLGIRRTTARYACSLAALVAMLLCPLATLAYLSLPSESAAPAMSVLETPGSEAPETVTLAESRAIQWLAALQPLALAAWLVGVSALGLRLLTGAIGLSYLRRGRQPLPLDLASLVERLGRRMALDALPLVFISRQVSEAMAVGLVRPLVLIPAAWVTEMPLPLLEAVIAHELAHLRRRDLWVNLLQRLAESLLFYHPAVWWLSRRLRTERELCADELAVAATGRRLEYAQALEQVAHRRLAEVRPALAAFMRGETNMRVLERVRNVLGAGSGERSRLWPVGLAALALPAALWMTASAWSSATAQEREKKDDVKVEAKFFAKDGEKRDEPRREGDVKKDAPRDGEARKEGPRDGEVRKEVRRDSEVKKDVARDGEPRKVVTRDGEVRKEGPRDGEPRRDVERKIVARDSDRPAGEAARIEELTTLVKRLAAQVERLQAEVTALRGGKGEISEKEAVLRSRLKEGAVKEGAGPKEEVVRKLEGALREKIRDGERKVKEGGDKPAAEGERREAAIRKLEAVKERAAADDKEAAARERELIARKRAAVAEAEKEAAVKKEAAAKEAAAKKEEKKEDK